MEIGTKIRVSRLERGLQQQQLAADIGVSPSTLSQIESGQRKPSYEQLEKISRELGEDLGSFSDRESERIESRESRQPRLGEIISMIKAYPKLNERDKKIIIQSLKSFAEKWEMENPW